MFSQVNATETAVDCSSKCCVQHETRGQDCKLMLGYPGCILITDSSKGNGRKDRKSELLQGFMYVQWACITKHNLHSCFC